MPPGNGNLGKKGCQEMAQHASHSAPELLLPLGAEDTLDQGTIVPSKDYLLHHQAKLVDLVNRNHTEIYLGEKVQVSKNPEEISPNQNFSE